MNSKTNAAGEKFCSSCFKYRPANEVHLVPSSNGRQNILRCDKCNQERDKAAAAKAAAAAEAAAKKEAKKATKKANAAAA